MKRYAVGAIDLDGMQDLQIKIVGADGWKEALSKAFYGNYVSLSDDLKTAKAQARDQFFVFDVVEIP